MKWRLQVVLNTSKAIIGQIEGRAIKSKSRIVRRTETPAVVFLNRISPRASSIQESRKSIQIKVFHVFKLFVANQKKTPGVVGILIANKHKLLRLLSVLKYEKEDDQFEADKAQVVREITALKSENPL